MRTLPPVAALCAVLLAAAPSGQASRSEDDPCLEPNETPVTLTTSDGATIYGIEVGTGEKGVVLGHQVFSSHCELMGFARELARLGHRVLAIDFRGYGASSRGSASRLDRDVAAAVGRLRTRGSTRIMLVGASMGGTAVLVAGSRITPPVNGVVSLSAAARYGGLDAVRAVRRSRVPTRFLAARRDVRFAQDARTLMRASASRDKAIVVYSGSRHGSSLLDLPRAKAYVLRFLAR